MNNHNALVGMETFIEESRSEYVPTFVSKIIKYANECMDNQLVVNDSADDIISLISSGKANKINDLTVLHKIEDYSYGKDKFDTKLISKLITQMYNKDKKILKDAVNEYSENKTTEGRQIIKAVLISIIYKKLEFLEYNDGYYEVP